jgi:hypothetical protein
MSMRRQRRRGSSLFDWLDSQVKSEIGFPAHAHNSHGHSLLGSTLYRSDTSS